MALNSRIPRTFSYDPSRKALFKRAPGFGIQLNVPVYSLETGQVGTMSDDGAAKLALGSDGTNDEFLKINEDGSASIKL